MFSILKKIISLVTLVFLLGHISWAQNPKEDLSQKNTGKLTGVVIDSVASVPVEFATVALLDPITDNPVNGTVCDDQGKFTINKIPRGNYTLLISFIGFESKRIAVTISDKKNHTDVGRVVINPVIELLDEVVVQGQKVLVEEKVDRTIYNAENDLTTKGGDASDVLKRVPLLTVDMDGNVSLRGSSSVKVLINGKPSTITATSVADALKQIPADMVKTVEVITSPSSKYDAEGSAGIINIITKKNTLEGVFATVDGTAGTRGSNLSMNLAYRKRKMGFSFGAFNRSIYNVHGKFINNQQTQSLGDTTINIQSATTRADGVNSQYTFGWDYDINKFNVLTVSARYGSQDQNAYQDQLLTQNIPFGGTPSSSLKNVKTTSVSSNFDASLTYTKSFEKKGREFNFLGVYSENSPDVGFVTNTISEIDHSLINSYKNENQGKTVETTLQADFQEPLGKNQLIEFGGKDINRTVTSAYTYLIAQGSAGEYQPSPNPTLTNGFNYDQRITSGYVAYTLTANKYTLKAGGRYEYTDISAHFVGQPDITIPSYGVLVPSINISRKLANGNLVKVSFNRRIQRPSLRDLNPNVQASNPLNISVGNPYLTPEYADNYEIAYKTAYKIAAINLSMYLRNNTDDIQSARSVKGDTIISTVQNIGTEANYGVSAFASVPISNHFSINGGIDLYYRILKNNSPDPFINATNQGLVQNYRFFGNYNFPKGWDLQFFVFFQGKNFNLQGFRTNPINHSLAIKKDIMHKNGSLGLGIDNFLTPVYDVNSELKSPYLSQSQTNTLYNFMVKVNFSYRIGRVLESKKKKSLIDEERDN